MAQVTCMTLAKDLTAEAEALRKTKDDMTAFVECYNGLAEIFHSIDRASRKEDLDIALESNGTCDIDLELVQIMAECLEHFTTEDLHARYTVSRKIMAMVHFLHFLHNSYLDK